MPNTKGAQCRTMLSQRPCGMHVCTRPECRESKPYRVHAACGKAHSVYDTTCDTENGVTGSQSVPQTEGDTEPTYTLTGLSARDVERIAHALRMLRRIYTRESSMYAEVSELGSRVIAVRKGE